MRATPTIGPRSTSAGMLARAVGLAATGARIPGVDAWEGS